MSFTLIKAQNFDAYQLYDKKAKVIKPEKMIKELAAYDVVLFGENHNSSINHWLQLKVTEGLEVVDAIAATPTGRQDRPVEDQKIKKITVFKNVEKPLFYAVFLKIMFF